MKDSSQIIVNLLPPESEFDLQADNVNEKPDDIPDKPIIPPNVRLSTPYHSDIGDSGIESGSESDFNQQNIAFTHRNLSTNNLKIKKYVFLFRQAQIDERKCRMNSF